MSSKEIRDHIGSMTALLAFVFGFGLCIAGFCVPPVGEISGSVLWVLGQSLLYCGGILGISEHYASKVKEFENKIENKLNEK